MTVQLDSYNIDLQWLAYEHPQVIMSIVMYISWNQNIGLTYITHS